MDGGALAHEAGTQVAANVVEPLVGEGGQRVGVDDRPAGVVNGTAVALPGQTGDVADRRAVARGIERRRRAGVGKAFEQLEQRRLALSPDDVVDERGVDRRVGIQRREVAAPGDRVVGWAALIAADISIAGATWGPGMTRHADEGVRPRGQRRQRGVDHRPHVSVEDPPGAAALEHGAQVHSDSGMRVPRGPLIWGFTRRTPAASAGCRGPCQITCASSTIWAI